MENDDIFRLPNHLAKEPDSKAKFYRDTQTWQFRVSRQILDLVTNGVISEVGLRMLLHIMSYDKLVYTHKTSRNRIAFELNISHVTARKSIAELISNKLIKEVVEGNAGQKYSKFIPQFTLDTYVKLSSAIDLPQSPSLENREIDNFESEVKECDTQYRKCPDNTIPPYSNCSTPPTDRVGGPLQFVTPITLKIESLKNKNIIKEHQISRPDESQEKEVSAKASSDADASVNNSSIILKSSPKEKRERATRRKQIKVNPCTITKEHRAIIDHWNSFKQLMKFRETELKIKELTKALKSSLYADYGLDACKDAITNYASVIEHPDRFYTHQFSLALFLKSDKTEKFIQENFDITCYIRKKSAYEIKLNNEKREEEEAEEKARQLVLQGKIDLEAFPEFKKYLPKGG